MKRTVSWQCCI